MILSDYAITQESLQNNQNKQSHTPSPLKKPKHNTQTTPYASSSTVLVLLQKLFVKEERKICK